MKYAFLTVIGLALPSLAAPLSVLNFSNGTGSVSFQAVGRPAAIKINGEGDGPKGTLTLVERKLSGELTFNLASLKTGIDLRDTHMKDKYLEVGKFPQSKLVIDNLEVPPDYNQGNESHLKAVLFKGHLTLKNTTKDVSGTCDVDRVQKTTNVAAQFTIRLPEYGIEIPKYLGITVAEEVNVRVATKTPIEAQ